MMSTCNVCQLDNDDLWEFKGENRSAAVFDEFMEHYEWHSHQGYANGLWRPLLPVQPGDAVHHSLQRLRACCAETRDHSVPSAADRHVQLECLARRLLRVQSRQRSGLHILPHAPTAENPFRVGFDMAGKVVEVGSDVKDYKVGDEIFAIPGFVNFGTFGEHINIETKFVAPKPSNMSWNEAAGVPLAGQTSWQALVTYGKLQKGQRVLILGGSSGTGRVRHSDRQGSGR
ncbi:hypothetical protein V7S43_002353 [Phytophthora oleae]|uniref:Alcohol dehydrogenase-like N-terminal domain-containing protein n=1 Tax=Phytophthora oleae TaxID=2107226 RepID=A0ABD3G258_9STRA